MRKGERRIKCPEECSSMEDVRGEIDLLDRELIDLMVKRFAYVDKAWQIKRGGPERALVPWRVQDVIDKVKAHANEQGLPPELIESMWRPMIDWCIQYESEKLEEPGEEQE